MENYEKFDQYLEAQSKSHQKIILELNKIIEEISPSLDKVVKWGNGCWVNGKLPVMFVHCKEDHVQFGFYGGALLKDPEDLLQGKAEYVRHIPFTHSTNIDKSKLKKLIKQATNFDYKA